MDKLTQEQFIKYLRDGLSDLRDPHALRRSPLVFLFHIPARFDAPAELQRILTEAVQSLEPQAGESPDSHAWRMYESLFYRYIEQYDQETVGSQLGMSARQVRREQKAALEVLSYKLWDNYLIAGSPDQDSPGEHPPAEKLEDLIAEEVSWLKDGPPEDPADLTQLLPGIITLFQPLAQEYGVVFSSRLDEVCPKAAVDTVAMRQVLVNLLGIAVPRAARHSQLQLSTILDGAEIQLEIHCPLSPSDSVTFSSVEQFRLDVSRVLLQHFGGRLAVGGDPVEFSALLSLPGLERLPLMLVDDNDGIHQLFQRYTSGTRYRLFGTHNPAETQAMVEKFSPQVIILDVMMPRVDGWELLGRLSSNNQTSQIPVIVCTIMAQAELAFSLGAKGFLQKPVTRQALLTELDRLVVQPDSASR